jgi:hypothetical protein
MSNDISKLDSCCQREMASYLQGLVYNTHCCLDLFGHALHFGSSEAWEIVIDRFTPHVRGWLYRHPFARSVLAQYQESQFINGAFANMFEANHQHQLRLTTLEEILSYLRRCLNTSVIKAARTCRPGEIPIELSVDPPINVDDELFEGIQPNEVWNDLVSCTDSTREARLCYLRFVEKYKPAEIMEAFPEQFADRSEIYALLRKIVLRFKARFGPKYGREV